MIKKIYLVALALGVMTATSCKKQPKYHVYFDCTGDGQYIEEFTTNGEYSIEEIKSWYAPDCNPPIITEI